MAKEGECRVTDEDEDAFDDEALFDSMCEVVASQAGISVEQCKAVLEAARYHAYGHCGIVDMLEVVHDAVSRKN
jgi:hypothetical protein